MKKREILAARLLICTASVPRNSDLKGGKNMLRITAILLVFVFLCPLYAQEEETRKIAVASEGETPEASVSSIAARCAYFLFFDGDGVFLDAVENPYKDARGGAGDSAAEFLAEKKVTVLLAGHFGEKMKKALESSEIEYVESRGTVADAVGKFLERDAVK